jgi:uncharacterized protein (DUF952 family)
LLIYKILDSSAWREAKQKGRFDGSAADRADGFIHFSDAATVRETAARHFAGRDDLLLVAVEAEALGETLKWEAAREGALFPHLYAPLAVEAAVWIKPLPLGPDGRHRFPDAIP